MPLFRKGIGVVNEEDGVFNDKPDEQYQGYEVIDINGIPVAQSAERADYLNGNASMTVKGWIKLSNWDARIM